MYALIGIGVFCVSLGMLAPMLACLLGIGVRRQPTTPTRVIRERGITSGFNWDSICHS